MSLVTYLLWCLSSYTSTQLLHGSRSCVWEYFSLSDGLNIGALAVNRYLSLMVSVISKFGQKNIVTYLVSIIKLDIHIIICSVASQ